MLHRLLLFSLLFCFTISFANDFTGYELAKILNDKEQPITVRSDISMMLTNKRGKSRFSEMISLSKDKGNFMLLFFKKPKRDKGIGLLKIENDNSDKLSLYIPKLKKIRRISSDSQSDSFMGSDLSFEDLLSRDLDDFKYTIISEDDNYFVLESIPLQDDSEYGKHISWILKKLYLTKSEESFDKDGQLLKTKSFSYIDIGKYSILSQISVMNVQTNHNTVLNFNDIIINEDISNDIFQEKNLKRIDKFTRN